MKVLVVAPVVPRSCSLSLTGRSGHGFAYRLSLFVRLQIETYRSVVRGEQNGEVVEPEGVLVVHVEPQAAADGVGKREHVGEGYGHLLVLFLAEPAEVVGEHDSVAPVVRGGVCAGAVKGAAEPEQDGAGGHLGADDLAWRCGAVGVPPVATGHELGAAVVCGEV